ncbi:XPG I-like protein [Elsinoe australis]|uniref:XPG I-like protein n=1 Tax=Elsinoe australis TaxID=40998 RepID=A0A4U7B0S2_9PEZI|nr:XPG I-like protein [Elsinoe australis]
MGIHGIYKEIGPGRRVALSKYAVEHYVQHNRPLRIAIDISIWLFQIQSGKGGSNPALRTFYYRLLRILSLNIHPLFVFDGPNKPPFKRNKRVGGPNVKVSSIPEFLAKQLLKQFGFPMHLAPGEAEAECALLQREGIVDAVLSEDVDTLMFGSGTTMRSWTPEAKSSKVPTHVNVYDAPTTKEGSGLDREGMILIALMSGGDYIPEGIPGCGPKTACEAARAGFGAELCKLKKRDDAGFKEWRERLRHELWTNESKLFKQRRRLDIPDDFPNREVLGYYTSPCISGPDRLATLRDTLRWDMPLDYPSLRSFTADAFDWVCIGGAKKFIRNLAPAILTRELRLRAEQGANDGDDLEIQASAEDRLVKAIHGKRTHASTDNMPEIRISFLPMNIIPIDLSQEPPDEEAQTQPDDDADSDAPVNDDVGIESNCPASPRKRGPSKYNPEEMEKIWMMDVFLRHGVPLKVQDWEASFKDPKKYLATKRAAKEAGAKKKTKANGGMPRGALDRFTRVSKPGLSRSDLAKARSPELDSIDLSEIPSSSAPARLDLARPASSQAPPSSRPVFALPASRRTALDEVDLSNLRQPACQSKDAKTSKAPKRPSPEPLSPAPHHRSKSETPKSNKFKQATIIDLLSSPAAPSRKLDFGATPPPPPSNREASLPPLPDTVTKRRRKSPFKRHETAPAALKDICPGMEIGMETDEDDLDFPELPTLEQLRANRTTTTKTRTGRPTATVAAQVEPPSRAPTGVPDEVDLAGPTVQRHSAPKQTTVESIDLSLSSPPPPSTAMPQDSFLSTQPTERQSIFAPFVAAFQPSQASNVSMNKAGKIKKKHYQVRESLEGAWKEVEVEVEIDLTLPSHAVSTGVGSGIMAQFARPKGSVRTLRNSGDKEEGKPRTRFRKSEVEVLDLTSD